MNHTAVNRKLPATGTAFHRARLWEVRTGPALTRGFRTLKKVGSITHLSAGDRDLVIFPEKINEIFRRLNLPCRKSPKYGMDAPAIRVVSVNDLLRWFEEESKVLAQGKYAWEGRKVGANTQPIKIQKGRMVL